MFGTIIKQIAIAIISLLTVNSAFGQDQSGAETGKKIGTIVRTAIDTALPGVSSIMELIWTKGDKDRIRKDELEDQVKSATKQLKIEAQKQVQPISTISDELLLVGRFLEPSVNANALLLRMQTRMSSSDALSEKIWSDQKDDWDVVKNHLNILKNISDNDLEKAREIWLRNTLKKIRDANLDSYVRVQSKLTQKDIPGLRSELENLTNSLKDITAVVGYELSNLQQDIKSLSNWANGAAGDDKNLSPQQKLYKDILVAKYGN